MRYFELAREGRDAFLRQAAPAALVRDGGPLGGDVPDEAEATLIASAIQLPPARPAGRPRLAVFPLEKKPGAPFSDMITVGRTGNNDVVLNDVTVSRFHAYFKRRDAGWVVCDAGSKNGTRIDGVRLEPRREAPIAPGAEVVFGEVRTSFYPAGELYELLVHAD
ncbi:MAG: FHA domain-containing protein [Deltaproteobacteria bacterium]|nr:MAG: FHA domain-containing protein [Deltaproteobacteria bacterium]